MSGESKGKILDLIPEEYKARTILVLSGSGFDTILNLIEINKLTFPIIAKPDVGERGKGVQKIDSIGQLRSYIQNHDADFLIQEYIDYPIELGIFYHRIPGAEKGNVTSVTQKKFLEVTGDGKSTVLKLMEELPRARLQIERLTPMLEDKKNYIPKIEETVLLELIGNHCRGTTFLNANDIIDEELQKTIDQISKKIPGFYFGRYDLRCRSIEELKKGNYIKIMELNGAGAEASHIYQPGFSILEGYKVLFKHWKIMYTISTINHKNGIPYLSFQEGKRAMFG